MRGRNPDLLEAALRYADLGYAVFPCWPGAKEPMTPNGFKDATTDAATIRAWWTRTSNANVAMPAAGLLVVDIDGPDNSWPGERDLSGAPVSRTPRGGRHHIFRQPAGRGWRNTTSRIAPRVDTRADGGYIVVPPSRFDGKPYEWAEPLGLPPDGLPEPPAWLVAELDGQLPLGFNGTGNANGTPLSDTPCRSPAWPPVASVENVIPSGQRNDTLARLAGSMRRVGMGPYEITAALLETNARRCTPPLQDAEVRRIAKSIARYDPDDVTVAVTENHWARHVAPADDTSRPDEIADDPGSLPEDLLRVPGFISEVMDHCLATAPYPNLVAAFGGALALQATLAGRKVRDPGDNRTNLYLLALAHSSAGKERPRKINAEILHTVGLSSRIGGRFASGEGIQDALFTEPCMLFQTDEIDGMLQSINKARDARHEGIMGTMLTLYSSANSVFPMRRKAGGESPGAIDQPCLVLFGTAIPNHYYEALSERMLTNGFFARMIILECGKRSPGQEPTILPIPDRVLETARWWADFRPDTGNLESWYPGPRTVPQTDAARAILIETRKEAEAEYARAEAATDAVGTTVWGRVSEHARKLALLHAVSADHEHPEIGEGAADWARRFVVHQTKRMLFMAQAHVADSPFHADCLKAIQKLRDAPGGELSHSVLLKRMKTDAKSFLSLIATLEQRGDIVVRTQSSLTKPGRYYRLARSLPRTEDAALPGGERSGETGDEGERS